MTSQEQQPADMSADGDHVYNPISRQWVKKGSPVHKRLVKAGLLPDLGPCMPPMTLRGNYMKALAQVKQKIDAAAASNQDPGAQAMLHELLQEYDSVMKQKKRPGPPYRGLQGAASPSDAPQPLRSKPIAIIPAPAARRQRKQPVSDVGDDTSDAEFDAPPPPKAASKSSARHATPTAAVKSAAKKLLANKIEEIMRKHETEFSDLDASEVEDRVNRYLRDE